MSQKLFSQEYLEKLAASKKEDGFLHTDAKAEHERDLIRKVQESNGTDFFAMNELIQDYRGTINNATRSSGLTSVMDYETAYQEGIKAFKELIKKNFDLNDKTARPATYITGALLNSLRKVSNNSSDFGARKSEELQMKSKPKSVAEAFLTRQLDRKPDYDETLKFIKGQMRTGKSITKENLKRIDMYGTKELSGSQQIGGGENSEGAEFLTLNDITNVKKETPDEIMEKQMNEQRIFDHLRTFTLNKNERVLIMNMYGMGKFENKKANSLNHAAINAGMTNYEAKKTLDRYKKSLEQNGLL